MGPHILYRAVKIDFRIAKMDFTGKAMVTGRAVIYFFGFQMRDGSDTYICLS